MSTLTDVLTLIAIAVGGYFAYSWFNQATSTPNPPATTGGSSTTAPSTIWNPLQYIVPSTAPDLVTQWQQNIQALNAAGDLGGQTATWSWNPLDDISYLQQWGSSVLGATGLRW